MKSSFLLALGLGGAYIMSTLTIAGATGLPDSSQVACTMDARQCPDGSYVGRTGPRCEFAACPSGTGSVTPPVVGGDRDQYGCKPSTGYTWDSSRQMCCRSWEANTCVAPEKSGLTDRQKQLLDRQAKNYMRQATRRGSTDLDSPFLRGVIARLDARPTERNQYLKELLQNFSAQQ